MSTAGAPSSSEKLRQKGVSLYKYAMNMTAKTLKRGKLMDAQRCFAAALETAQSPGDTARALRNIAVVSAARADLAVNDDHFIAGYMLAIEQGLSGLRRSHGQLPMCWDVAVFEQVARWIKCACDQIAICSSLQHFGALAHLVRTQAQLFPEVQAVWVYENICSAAMSLARKRIREEDHTSAISLLCDCETMMSIIASNAAGSATQTFIDAYPHLKTTCAVVNELESTEEALNTEMYEKEEPDMWVGWSLVDALTMAKAELDGVRFSGTVAKPEAQLFYHLGRVWDVLLADKKRAVTYYRNALMLAQRVKPQPTEEAWFKRLQLRVRQLQSKVVEQEEQELRQAAARARPRLEVIEKCRKEVDAETIMAALLPKVRTFLRQCEQLLPFMGFNDAVLAELKVPEWRGVITDEIKAEMKKVLKAYMVRFHPDKWKHEGECGCTDTARAKELHAVARLATQNISAVYTSFK